MNLFTNRFPANLPLAPQDYKAPTFNTILSILNLYFKAINAVQQINIAKLNIDIGLLPTETDLTNLRSGDVYRDTADNSLKIKV
jgi:hypothetical protein